MRSLASLLALTGATALPLLAGPWLVANASARQLVLFGMGALTAMGAGLIVLLGSLVEPGNLPATDLPALVGRCVDAASDLLRHPVSHWPQIMAASLLLVVLSRLAYATIVTFRDARREVRALEDLSVPTTGGGDVVVVSAARPFAFAAGVVRRRVVVSSGLLSELDATGRRAVLAHERAHVRGWHAGMLLVGRSVARAFPFLPPVREAADQLLLGLEMAADEAAVKEVGDPLIVAKAMVHVAGDSRSAVMPAAAGGDLLVRVSRLTRTGRPSLRSRFGASAAVVFLASILVSLAISLPASARALSDGTRIEAEHAVCHLPHATGR